MYRIGCNNLLVNWDCLSLKLDSYTGTIKKIQWFINNHKTKIALLSRTYPTSFKAEAKALPNSTTHKKVTVVGKMELKFIYNSKYEGKLDDKTSSKHISTIRKHEEQHAKDSIELWNTFVTKG